MYLEKFKNQVIPIRRRLLDTATAMLHNAEDAEDAVQETYLKLWNCREKFDKIENPGAFATQTIKNICIDKIRSKKEETDSDEVTEMVFQTPYSDMELKDSVEIIKRIIDKLPELQRIIIKMRDVEGYELEEIAEITGAKTNAVTVNLSRARKKVRDIYLKMLNYNAV